MDYPGKVITKTQVTPTQTSASGNWTVDDAIAAVKNNNWPVALVPNPISKSLRFNSADSAYLNRTPASASNRRTFTMNYWLKRTELGTRQVLASAGTGANAGHEIEFQSDNTLAIYSNAPGASVALATTQVFRDPSAWGMLTIAFDTTQATDTNRIKVYWNGTQITAFSSASYPAQNADLEFNNNVPHNIGRREISTTFYCGLYLTEIVWVNGQQLTPSSFGMTNPQTGQWIPLKYSGTYGTNGFYLNFKDATSTTTLGYDYSGNANNWTTNNFSVTAGAGNDSLTDVPTPWFAYNTTGDVGGVIRGNYATWNPLDKDDGITSVTNGNLNVVTNGSNGSIKSTIAFPSGKWYWEVTSDTISGSGTQAVGIIPQSQPPTNNMSDSGKLGYALDVSFSDRKFENGTATSYGTYTQANGAIYMLAFDQAAGKLWYGINGTWLASGDPAAGTNASSSSIPTTTAYCAAVSDNTVSGTFTANFGQRAFAYTPPTGFRSLCTTNLPATAIGFGLTNQADDYFNAILWTGNSGSTGTTRTQTGVGFQPDLVWIKNRSNAYFHNLYDSVRGSGSTKNLSSNTTGPEGDSGYAALYGYVSAFNSDGFQTTNGTDALPGVWVNQTSQTYVAWNWKASGSTVSNTAGTITSTVSANTTAGFSVVTFTGTGANATVGHGLGVAPSMYIVKNRPFGGSWGVYHISIGATNRLLLNGTNASTADSGFWNNTAPTSTVFSVGNDGAINRSGDSHVAYCFAAVPGYSAFGSYTGNGSSDGPFIFTNFRPRWVLVKASSTTSQWVLWDSARNTYNVTNSILYPNLSAAESSFAIDILSNGFKFREAGGAGNDSGVTYIYAAFAESPFQFSNAR